MSVHRDASRPDGRRGHLGGGGDGIEATPPNPRQRRPVLSRSRSVSFSYLESLISIVAGKRGPIDTDIEMRDDKERCLLYRVAQKTKLSYFVHIFAKY